MRLLLFSDLHLDRPFRWLASQPAAARKLRRSLRDTLTRIVNLAAESEVDALVCGGDLFEQQHHSGDMFRFLVAAFEPIDPVPVFVAPGNHDWCGRKSLYGRMDWPGHVHIFRSDRFEPVRLDDGVTLWGVAHQSPTNTRNLLQGFAVNRGGINLALFHGSDRAGLPMQGSSKTAHAPFEKADIRQAGFDHAFLGHYHVPRDNDLYTYPGNPHPLTFGEDGERGAVLVELSQDGQLARKHLRVAETEFHDLSVDVTGCATAAAIRDRVTETAGDRHGYARITVSGELPPDLEFQPSDLEDLELHFEACKVRVGALTDSYDMDRIAQESTVRGEFVRMVQSADCDEDTKRRVVTTGLRALDGRRDLEVH